MDILWLEDEGWQISSTVVTVMQKKLGHRVTWVKTPAEAIAELQTWKFDALFIDVMMDPNKGHMELASSGLDVVQRVLSGDFAEIGNAASMCVVIASGVWDATIRDSEEHRWVVEDFVRRMGIPPSHFLRKPFLIEEVSQALTECQTGGAQ